jgi:hypothetical protein
VSGHGVGAVERFEAWWTAKQVACFREAYYDAPELHGTEREKQWGMAFKRKELAAYLAGAAELDALSRRVAELEGALAAMVKCYVGLVECGDCGNWDAEAEPEVIAARAALKGQG